MPTDLRKHAAFEQSNSPDNPMDLDVDPRPVQKQKGVIRLTVETLSTSYLPRNVDSRPRPRWKTPEFIFYYVAFIIVVPFLFLAPMRLSRDDHPNFPLYQKRLSSGWIFGRKIDNSDAQYRSFRNNIPALTIISASFFGLQSIYARAARHANPPLSDNILHRIPFLVTFSLLMVTGLHGASILKIMFILSINYSIAKVLGPSKINPVITWIFNMAVLFANERNSGYKFASLSPSLAYLDSVQGVHPRWYISFNITMLRLVSFNMDYFWASRNSGPRDTGLPLEHKQRTSIGHPTEFYSFVNYIAYVLYPPLYIAGPIMTFNDFIWQHRRPTSIPSRSVVATYLVRFIACLLTMEFVLHYMYVVAIKDASAWKGDTSFELSMIGLWNLIIVWLKLLIPWRFFRLWALADGVDPPENMIRCVCNNYSTLGFWRSWHRSYSLWTLRYIYVPLGGTKNRIYTTVLVFSFVALWHDLSFRLLAWGWLVSLFILPEVAAQYFLPASKYYEEPWYRHVCAVGGVLNTMMMMVANLIGFVIGIEGATYMLKQMLGSFEGIRFLFTASVCMFIAIQVMFEYREEEMRQGVFRKC
ncbi:MBOAT-domain-containing protein [Rickenella mellea]|uniref:MBOAT-domain-containing protein n=1 Tax=Rickenella mellea TaxID=50990 RepID=A0A4Y7QDJ6_9AGAM|nr:MBOAT-domain-containing protein [Rickenella mellea]